MLITVKITPILKAVDIETLKPNQGSTIKFASIDTPNPKTVLNSASIKLCDFFCPNFISSLWTSGVKIQSLITSQRLSLFQDVK